MTGRSFALLAAALAALAAALATGGSVYYLAAFLLFGVWAAALLSVIIALLSVRVRVVTKSARAVRGETVSLRLKAGSRGFLPVAEIRVGVESALSEPETGELAVEPAWFGEKEYRYVMQCPHRGVGSVCFSSVQVTDVFHLFTFKRKLKKNQTTVKVMPRERQAEPLILEPGDAGVESQARATEDAASPSDIRAWREGDSLKKIHWKLSVRRREVMVRTYEERMRSDTLVLLDAAAGDAPRMARKYAEDALCECALAAARAQLMANHPVRMPVACRTPFELSGQNAYDYPRFLEKLGEMRFDGKYPYEQYLAVEMRRLLRTGAVILATTQLNARLAEAALRMRRMNILVRYLWVSDVETEDDVALMARLGMEGVKVERINPWEDAA